MATTYMVSYHDADDQEDPTENEEKVDLEEIKVTKEEGSETHALEEAVALCAHCRDKMMFADEDFLLGSKPHNQLLFVSGYTRGERVSRILIDDGSAVNIMPKGMMRRLGISMEELSKSRLVIQGFNQEGQRAIGMIRLDVTIDELKARPLFRDRVIYLLRNLCVQISGTPGGTKRILPSFVYNMSHDHEIV